MIKRGCRGQFYIIAAAIIAVLLVGLAATVNYAVVSSTPTRFYDLKDMYQLEAPKVVDQGIYQGNINQINETLVNFTNVFYQNAKLQDPNIQITVIYGNESKIAPIGYGAESINITNESGQQIGNIPPSEVSSTTTLQVSGGENVAVTTTQQGGFNLREIFNPTKKISVMIGNISYNVRLGSKQYFYFIIISKKPTGEVSATTS
jgi:hypothetical protein